LTDFREPLTPYGQWTQDPTYGTVWVPDSAQVGTDFAPYQTGGQWVVDDGGDWMWQSDYAWGFIPFHYGRWVWAGSYWGWIPGRRYAPAWVTWRVGEGGYIGWAPLPPTWYWGRGVAVGLWTTPYAAYCFVPTNYFFYRGVSSFVVRDRGMVQSIAATTRAYRSATPVVGHGGAMGYHHPTFSEAHIPASAVPRHQTFADARALGFSTRTATAATRAGYAPHQAAQFAPGQRAEAWRSSYSYPHPSRSQSYGLHTPGQSQVYSRPSFPSVHSAPSYHPSYHPSYGASGGFHPQAASPSSSHVYSAPSHSSFGHSSGRSGGHR
jgi:hypothetical protein